MRAQPAEVGCEARQTHGGPRSASPPVACAYGTGAGEGDQLRLGMSGQGGTSQNDSRAGAMEYLGGNK